MDNNQEQRNSLTTHADFLRTLSKRSEKLVTALYMVTDCIGDNEPSKLKLRTLSIDLISLSHAVPENGPYEKGVLLGELILLISEMETIMRIAGTVGLITEMNAGILLKEFSRLKSDVHTEQKSSFGGMAGGAPVKSFVLDPSIFSVEGVEEVEENKGHVGYKGQDFYTSMKSALSQGQTKERLAAGTPANKKETSSRKLDIAQKISRRNTILKLIKDMREVTIKDISQLISDCSEKTIQRELMSLVGEGIVKRTGEKRWSKYSLV